MGLNKTLPGVPLPELVGRGANGSDWPINLCSFPEKTTGAKSVHISSSNNNTVTLLNKITKSQKIFSFYQTPNVHEYPATQVTASWNICLVPQVFTLVFVFTFSFFCFTSDSTLLIHITWQSWTHWLSFSCIRGSAGSRKVNSRLFQTKFFKIPDPIFS